MKIKGYRMILLGIVAAAIFGCLLHFYPLWRSEEKQRLDLLRSTPLGTTMSDVEKKILEKGYRIKHVSQNVGFGKQEGGKSIAVGVKSIEASAGSFYGAPPYFIFETSVSYYWGFNQNGELIDIWVRKDVDAL